MIAELRKRASHERKIARAHTANAERLPLGGTAHLKWAAETFAEAEFLEDAARMIREG
jgi:hypothetical protein